MSELTLKWSNIFKPTPKNVSKWLLGGKGILLAVAGTNFVMGNDKASFYVLLTGACLDFFGMMIGGGQDA
jgi:hypothetical protein